jgi:hypothetical protein
MLELDSNIFSATQTPKSVSPHYSLSVLLASPLLLHQSFSFQPPSWEGHLVAYRSGRYLSLRYNNVAALRWLPRSGYSALLPSRNKLFLIYAPLVIRLNDVTSVKIEREWLCGKHGARSPLSLHLAPPLPLSLHSSSRRTRKNCMCRIILEIERGSTRSHPVENSLWKRLRTCRKTDCRMNEWKNKELKIIPTSLRFDFQRIIPHNETFFISFAAVF